MMSTTSVQGWIVRSGLLYGADFVLYTDHPTAVHADCCVLLMPQGRELSWNDLQISNRLCTQVWSPSELSSWSWEDVTNHLVQDNACPRSRAAGVIQT